MDIDRRIALAREIKGYAVNIIAAVEAHTSVERNQRMDPSTILQVKVALKEIDEQLRKHSEALSRRD